MSVIRGGKPQLALAWEIQLFSNAWSMLFSAQLIRALWEVARSFFTRVPEPRCSRVVSRAVRRQSGFSIRMDIDLLSCILYGDDIGQADQDELLTRLKHASASEYREGWSRCRCTNSKLVGLTCFNRLTPLFYRLSASTAQLLDGSDSDSRVTTELGPCGKVPREGHTVTVKDRR